MNARPALSPATNPAACFSWLPLEELTRLAAVAHAMAASDCFPAGAFFEDGVAWMDRETFFSGLLDNLRLLLAEHASAVGAGDMPGGDPERLAVLRRKNA